MSARSTTAITLAFVLTLIGGCHPAPGHAAGARAQKEPSPGLAPGEWPDTPAGKRARGWVTAYGAGEKAMRAYTKEAMSPASLERRGIGARMEAYRTLFERMGALRYAAVLESEPHVLRVRLFDAEARTHEFVFRVGATAPHHLESVAIHGRGHGHGTGSH